MADDGIEYLIAPAAEAGEPGVTDHGALTGLADDDHPQYETSAEAAAKVTTHEAAANPHSVYALDTDLSTHEADTTNIHGITDTSALATSSSVTSAVSTHAGLSDPHTGYVQESADNRMWMPSHRFVGTTGSPINNTVGGGTRFVGWQFDAAAVEQVNGTTIFPAWWATFDVDVYWSNSSGGTGDVKWQMLYSAKADTEDLATGDVTLAPAAVTAPLVNILKVTTLGSAQTITASKLYHFRFSRDATHASDTLANDAVMFGLMFRRAS